MIATGGADGGVLFWKATSSKDGIKVKLHARSRELSTEPIYGIAFSADGKLVASSGKDKLLRLWNPEDGTRVGIPLVGHSDRVRSVAFSSSGDFIVSAGDDQKLLWWLGPQNWAKALCKHLTQNMSKKQWHEWVSPDIEYHEQCPDLPIPPDAPAESPTTAATGGAK
jgi:WD40 repeat protein